MADVVLMSNKKSAVFSTLLTDKNSNTDLLLFKADYGISNFKLATYKETKTYVNAVTSLTFDLPANGILRRMYFVFEDSVNATGTASLIADGALNRISKISTLNNSSELLKMYPIGIRSWINSLPAEDQLRWNVALKSAGGAAVTTTAQTFVTVVPVPFSYCDGVPSRYWDLGFMDKISVQLDLKTVDRLISHAGGNAFVSGQVTLYYEFIQLGSDELKKYRAMQFPEDRPALFLLEDQELDRYLVTHVAAGGDVQLNSNVPATKTIFERRAAADTAARASVGDGAVIGTATGDITSFAIKANGVDIMRIPSAYAYQIANSSIMPMVFPGVPDGATWKMNGVVTIDYRLMELGAENCFTGGVSFLNLTGKALEINVRAGAADQAVTVVHCFQKYIQVASGTGRPTVVSAV